ncbi:oligosaccharide flippase family protein [Aestuariivirga sp.]|uniref:oligosaccharide flippase family protein n=1 Tax=Aestuariivirga sp. TaxID=2650926 RepID=UPI00391A5CD2
MSERSSISGILRSMPWPLAEAVAALFTGAISVFVIARLIGADEFGRSSIALGIVVIMLVGVNSLVHDALVRMPEMTPADLDVGFTASLAMAIVFVIAAAAAAPFIGALYEDPRLGLLILGFLALLPLAAVSETLIAERRRALDFRTVARNQIAARVLGGSAGVAAAIFHAGAWSLTIQYLTIASYTAAAMLVQAGRWPRLRFSWQRLYPMLAFCGPIIASQVMTQGTGRLLLLAIGHWHGLAVAGYWSAATRISENLFGGLMQAAYNVGLAHFSIVQAARGALLSSLRDAQAITAILSIPLLSALAATAEPLTLLLLGPGWAPVSTLMYGPLAASFLLIRRMFPTTTLRAVGRSGVSLTASSVEFITLVAVVVAFGRLSPVSFNVIYPLAILAGSIPVFALLVQELRTPAAEQLLLFLKDASAGLLAFLAGRQAAILGGESAFSQLLLGGGVAFSVAATLLVLSDSELVVRIVRTGTK